MSDFEPSKEDTHAVLVAARALLTPPAAWTRVAFARNEAGNSTISGDPSAVCWCAVGAVNRAARTQFGVCGLQAMTAVDALATALGALVADTSGGVAAYNDAPERTHEEILELFDKAIDATAP